MRLECKCSLSSCLLPNVCIHPTHLINYLSGKSGLYFETDGTYKSLRCNSVSRINACTILYGFVVKQSAVYIYHNMRATRVEQFSIIVSILPATMD